ncbi:hypothetical protein PHYBLDRAFT_187143 [Phycomyces blakesleeanus NRRL 1555(-)]|uniref:Uncharacterized protein n=1 Tax=Phycomyces blakesleeanus (strain ATCC 8743b / DSM 1359 / FGSC 10004 / NBRC 33097 / NRRL 1555) TaxID=763407 RepID=A0A162U5E3_PHYB8|nr:hypothetical protein PHYBLDRAFT_187143 [Phycomyces blakesleeanus NRRL 1555(-)]OAD73572.1 hypothetical protein PHYBLDRAFT_187143 [Phycomyces blakesleeanus NRRL 1555(-)]|eukprot:XP_018291612.1 hypothetical protein PHYBLDRAFT_187143 [Phycomyces blakesleeanus NRRL 1555(-)]
MVQPRYRWTSWFVRLYVKKDWDVYTAHIHLGDSCPFQECLPKSLPFFGKKIVALFVLHSLLPAYACNSLLKWCKFPEFQGSMLFESEKIGYFDQNLSNCNIINLEEVDHNVSHQSTNRKTSFKCFHAKVESGPLLLLCSSKPHDTCDAARTARTLCDIKRTKTKKQKVKQVPAQHVLQNAKR